MKKKRKGFSTVLLILVFTAGLSLLLYPTFADYWNSTRASKTIAHYADAVAELDDDDFSRLWQEAVAYNEALSKRSVEYSLNEDQQSRYENTLNIGGSGVMGYIEIESIGVSLPIYHGTSDGVLLVAVGHLDWTSLPVGGKSSHCVLSGHRGLPSAKLFTNLDQLVEGDVFCIRVLDEVLTYEVDRILIVEPQNVEPLCIVPGEDYCTLVTCTPYGINTHRLLVRGHRIENTEEAAVVHVTSDAVQIEPRLVASVLAVLALLLLLILAASGSNKKRSLTGEERGNEKNKQ